MEDSEDLSLVNSRFDLTVRCNTVGEVIVPPHKRIVVAEGPHDVTNIC